MKGLIHLSMHHSLCVVALLAVCSFQWNSATLLLGQALVPVPTPKCSASAVFFHLLVNSDRSPITTLEAFPLASWDIRQWKKTRVWQISPHIYLHLFWGEAQAQPAAACDLSRLLSALPLQLVHSLLHLISLHCCFRVLISWFLSLRLPGWFFKLPLEKSLGGKAGMAEWEGAAAASGYRGVAVAKLLCWYLVK